MGLISWLFGKNKPFREDGHIYPDYLEVIYELTNKYRFKYTGIGDNGEECFFKDGDHPERIYIHPMGCTYHKEKVSSFECDSESCSIESQRIAYQALIKHLIKLRT